VTANWLQDNRRRSCQHWARTASEAATCSPRGSASGSASRRLRDARGETTGRMATPLVVGVGIAATAMSARAVLLAYEAWKVAPPTLRQFYHGGFEPTMSRREAGLILGVRESAVKDKVMAAHRKVMGRAWQMLLATS